MAKLVILTLELAEAKALAKVAASQYAALTPRDHAALYECIKKLNKGITHAEGVKQRV